VIPVVGSGRRCAAAGGTAAGVVDGGFVDAGVVDAGIVDAGVVDALCGFTTGRGGAGR
jgi:hypothetical protein